MGGRGYWLRGLLKQYSQVAAVLDFLVQGVPGYGPQSGFENLSDRAWADCRLLKKRDQWPCHITEKCMRERYLRTSFDRRGPGRPTICRVKEQHVSAVVKALKETIWKTRGNKWEQNCGFSRGVEWQHKGKCQME